MSIEQTTDQYRDLCTRRDFGELTESESEFEEECENLLAISKQDMQYVD